MQVLTINLLDLLVPNFHLRPFTPYLSEIVDVLEVDFGSFLQNLASVVDVRFCFACCTSLFIELGEIDVETVEVGSGPLGMDGFQSFGVCFRYLK